MWVFQRFIISLRRTHDNDFLGLSEIEHGRTDQIADILYKKDRSLLRIQMLNGMIDHVGLQMTAGTGIYLKHGNLQRRYTVGIV